MMESGRRNKYAMVFNVNGNTSILIITFFQYVSRRLKIFHIYFYFNLFEILMFIYFSE